MSDEDVLRPRRLPQAAHGNDAEQLSAELDAEIGRDLFVRLNRLTERIARRHGIDASRAADFLLAGSLFTAAQIYDLSLDETVEVMQAIAESVQHDTLEPEPRH